MTAAEIYLDQARTDADDLAKECHALRDECVDVDEVIARAMLVLAHLKNYRREKARQ